jgi:preprotein translocase subunit SecD
VTSPSTTIAGTVVVRWDFKGAPSTADAETTVARLDKRFADLHLPLRAELADGQMWVVEPSDQGSAMTRQAFSRTVLDALAQRGRFELRPVLDEVQPQAKAVADPPDLVAPQYEPPSYRGPEPTTYLLGPVALDGSAVESATAALNQAGQWEVRPVLHTGTPGVDQLNALAAQCFEGTDSTSCPTHQAAMVLDGKVLSAPTINSSSYGRENVAIDAGFDRQTALEVAAMLDSGELPAPLDVP